MQTSLIDLLSPWKTVSIIGMAKNVGKTTTLNHLIAAYERLGRRLALTSIGRDGEERDVVTRTEKPTIFIHAGTIAVTAESLIPLGDITKEIVMLPRIFTALGRVVVLRALSDGFVQLAGPSITAQIAAMLEDLHAMGAETIIVDGATGRKTLASPSVTEATILCTGASLHRDMGVVVAETAHAVSMLTLPALTDAETLAELDTLDESPDEEKIRPLPDGGIYLQGAVSDALISSLILAKSSLKGVSIIVEDPSKLFIKPRTYEKLLIKQGRLLVRTPIRLEALTINPVSAYGFDFHPGDFLEQMQRAVPLPVYNVKEEAACLT